MKKIIANTAFILSLLCIAPSYGQTSKAKKTGKSTAKKEIKSIYDFVDSVAVPEKYKTESVVILGHYEKSKLIAPNEPFKVASGAEKFSKAYVVDAFSITRYLLQDKNSLEKFSTYYFTESEYSKLGIAIIRKSGERVDLDMTKAISVSDEASLKLDNYNVSMTFGKYRKIALPGLEVGDMVEFSSQQFAAVIDPSEAKAKAPASISGGERFLTNYTNNFSYGYNSRYGVGGSDGSLALLLISATYFYPQIIATKAPRMKRVNGIEVPEYLVHLNKSYPVLKQTYEMTTFAETLPFEYSMLNGAAKPKITTSGENQTLKIESEMNDPVKEEYFMIPASNAPMVKISYNYKKFEKFNMHFDCQGKGLTDESASLLAKKMVNNKWHSNGITYFFNIEKEIGKKLKKMDNLEKLKYFYYYYKKNYSFSTLIASRGEAISSQTTMETTKLFQIFCDRYGIPYEVLMYSPRSSGATKNAVSGDRLRWGLLAHVGKEDVYLTDFDAYSEFNVPARFMYGTEVFYVSPKNDFSSRSAVFNGSNNYNKTEINTKATIDISKQLINVSAAYTIGGELKTEYYGMVNSTSDYFKVYDKLTGDGKEEEDDEDELNFMRIHYYSDDFREVEKQDEEKERLRKSFDKMASKNKNETYEEFVESMYQAEAEVTKVNNTNTGISTINSKEPETIEFTVDHTLKNTVQLVGEGAVAVELGRLIQTQAELAGLDDRKRVNDIDVNYQKQYIQKIEIALPAGYVPVNLDDFNTNVDNDLIGFVSVAKVEGNKLILTSTKTYKKVHADQKEWSKMMEALDASAHLFQKKLLLEKTN